MVEPCRPGRFSAAAIFRELDVQSSRACEEELSDAKTQEVQRYPPRGRGRVPGFPAASWNLWVSENVERPASPSSVSHASSYGGRETCTSRPPSRAGPFVCTALAGVSRGRRMSRRPRLDRSGGEILLQRQPGRFKGGDQFGGVIRPASTAQSSEAVDPGRPSRAGLSLAPPVHDGAASSPPGSPGCRCCGARPASRRSYRTHCIRPVDQGPSIGSGSLPFSRQPLPLVPHLRHELRPRRRPSSARCHLLNARRAARRAAGIGHPLMNRSCSAFQSIPSILLHRLRLRSGPLVWFRRP